MRKVFDMSLTRLDSLTAGLGGAGWLRAVAEVIGITVIIAISEEGGAASGS